MVMPSGYIDGTVDLAGLDSHKLFNGLLLQLGGLEASDVTYAGSMFMDGLVDIGGLGEAIRSGR